MRNLDVRFLRVTLAKARSVLTLCASLLVLCGTAATGGEAALGTGPVLRICLGGGEGHTAVAGTENAAFGVALGVQAGFSKRHLQLLADFSYQPFKVSNPVRSEAFTVLYALVSLQARAASGAYARLGVGPAFFRYSGADVAGPSDTSPALGATLGYERPTASGIRPGIEGIVRRSWSSDGELSARLLALQLTASWGRGR